MAAVESTSDTQMVTPLPSQFLVAFSALTIELRYFAQLPVQWRLEEKMWRLERAQQTTIFHLRTGHCGLSAHLKRTGISDTSLCECGQADQTPDHILQSCPKYAERRQLTWPQGADLVTKLWGSAEDLYRMTGFVASTRLKI